MKGFSLSVPANILLLGEYAVLEEGGRGVALATAPRLLVGVEAAAVFGIRGDMGATALAWDADSGKEPPPLLEACIIEAGAWLADAGLRPRFGPRFRSKGSQGAAFRVRIDSSAFFKPDGSKRGFGSSAAVAVGLVAALLHAGGLEGQSLEEAVFPVSLTAHRRAQGGRGSGYDVAASRFGSLGLFVGGANPAWLANPDFDLPLLWIFSGQKSVSSPSSAKEFQNWKHSAPLPHAAFFERSQAAVDRFLAATTSEAACSALAAAAELGLELGKAIGVSASLERPVGLGGGAVIKALGAGNELGLVALPRSASGQPQGLEELRPERAGLRWD
jgi:phosphomevalonate kinase